MDIALLFLCSLCLFFSWSEFRIYTVFVIYCTCGKSSLWEKSYLYVTVQMKLFSGIESDTAPFASGMQAERGSFWKHNHWLVNFQMKPFSGIESESGVLCGWGGTRAKRSLAEKITLVSHISDNTYVFFKDWFIHGPNKMASRAESYIIYVFIYSLFQGLSIMWPLRFDKKMSWEQHQ